MKISRFMVYSQIISKSVYQGGLFLDNIKFPIINVHSYIYVIKILLWRLVQYNFYFKVLFLFMVSQHVNRNLVPTGNINT